MEFFRRWWIWGLAVVVVLALGVWGVAAAIQMGASDAAAPTATEEGLVGDPEPEPEPDPVPVETPPATTDAAEVVLDSDAAELVMPPLAALGQGLKDPAVPVDLSSVAADGALGDLQNEIEQFDMDGLRQVGDPQIVAATVISRDTDDATAEIDVCLDRSAVDVVDTNGRTIAVTGPDRVRQIWTVALRDGVWKLTQRTFTDELEC